MSIKARLTFLLLSLTFGLVYTHQIYASGLTTKLRGKILLQTESNGEAWYVNPADETRYSLGKPDDAFSLMRKLGVGITNANLKMIQIADINLQGKDVDNDGLSDLIEDSLGTNKNKADSDGDGFNDKTEVLGAYNPNGIGKIFIDTAFASKQGGKILLQVEQKGEAWYVNPNDNKRYFLGKPNDAFSVMRKLGLGITNDNLNKVPTNEIDKNAVNNSSKSMKMLPKNSQIWKIVNEYKDAINKPDANINTIQSFNFKQFESPSEDDCKSIYPDKSYNDCSQLLYEFGSGKEDINNLNEKDLIIYENDKQGILFQRNKDHEIKVFSVKNSQGKWKLLKILHSAALNGTVFSTDTDRDGRNDEDETCTNWIYKNYPEKCIKSDFNKIDTDNDGWWDGIEVEADTNPNLKNENKISTEQVVQKSKEIEQPKKQQNVVPASKDESEMAKNTLVAFFDYLSKNEFEKALGLFSLDDPTNSWEGLASLSPSAERNNKAKVLENYCKATGTCLKAKVLEVKKETGDNYDLVVQFLNADGSVFVKGPCCGATEETMPSTSKFDFKVKKINNAFRASTAPVYRP